MLYEKRSITFFFLKKFFIMNIRFGPYFVEPIVCGLEGSENKPFIMGMDVIGALVTADDFVLAGASGTNLNYNYI